MSSSHLARVARVALCARTHAHTHTHTHTHTHHTHTHTHSLPFPFSYMCTLEIYMCLCVCMCMHTHACTHVRACCYTPSHAPMFEHLSGLDIRRFTNLACSTCGLKCCHIFHADLWGVCFPCPPCAHPPWRRSTLTQPPNY
jgi:hypothetical protein